VLELDAETGKLELNGEAGVINLLGGDPNAPTEPSGTAKPRLRLDCWNAVCGMAEEDPSRAGDPVRVLASFGMIDRPGAAFIMADGRVDTLGTASAELLVCREGGRTYPFSHCRDRVETPGLLGRVLDEVCSQGAAVCPR